MSITDFEDKMNDIALEHNKKVTSNTASAAEDFSTSNE
jgi:hypothetical protein